MTGAQVNFTPNGERYAIRFHYDAEVVALIKQLPSFVRSWQPDDKCWRVATPYANRLPYEIAALGCLITGLESVPESRKQHRNGDMYCSSRRRQRGYYRRQRAAK